MDFLQINTKYFYGNLKPIEFLILAKVEEFARNGQSCYISNENLGKMFNVSRGTIINSINRLIEKGLLEKANEKYNGKGKDIRILTIPNIEKNNPMGTKFEPIRVQKSNLTHTKIEPHGCKNCTPPMQNLNPKGSNFEPKHTNKTNKKNNIKKHTKQNRPSQEEFKEFFKRQGHETLANGFYEYCTNEKGWENITNWQAFAKGYIKNQYDLTKVKKPNKPKSPKKNHKTNEIPTQEDREALRQALEKMANEPIAPLKRGCNE